MTDLYESRRCITKWRQIFLAFMMAAITIHANARETCSTLPDAVLEVVSINIYGHAARSDVGKDEESNNERNRLTKPLNDYMNRVAHLASEAAIEGSIASARCALDGLSAWARDGGLMTEVKTEAARKELIWNSAGLSLAYLRVRAHATPADSAVIEPWLSAMAGKVVKHYGQLRRHDNVFAWSGLVAAAAAAATDDPSLWAEAVRISDLALAQVDSRGTLPYELQRGRRALAYHTFALVPMWATESLRRNGGYALSPSGLDALERLTLFSDVAVKNPDMLAALTNAVQDPANPSSVAVWRFMAAKRMPGQIQPSVTKGGVPFDRWLGGSANFF